MSRRNTFIGIDMLIPHLIVLEGHLFMKIPLSAESIGFIPR
jgi:hypothetical protein